MRSRRSPNRPCAHRSIERRAQLLPDAFGLVVHDDGGQSVQAVLHAVLDAALPSSTRRRRASLAQATAGVQPARAHPPHAHRPWFAVTAPAAVTYPALDVDILINCWLVPQVRPAARPPAPCSALARHATAPITRDTRTASLHAPRPAPRRRVFTAPPSSATSAFVCTDQLRAAGDGRHVRAAKRRASRVRQWRRRAALQPRCRVARQFGTQCRPVSMDVYTAYFCSCRDSCVVCLVMRLWRICLLAERRQRLSNPTRRAFYFFR